MNGKAIIFSAPSGAGKTSIVNELIQRIPTLRFSISVTTRSPRKGEEDGKDYYFVSVNKFRGMEENGELLEWEQVYDNIYYGTLKNEVDRIWNDGNQVIFDVDVAGGVNLKNIFTEDALSIFIKVKNQEVLAERLRKRNTESEEMLNLRLEKAVLEMQSENQFDEVIVNEDLASAVNQAEDLVKKFIA